MLEYQLMRHTAGLVTDMVTLARLHAALDNVIETQQAIEAIQVSSATPPAGVARLSSLLGEAREVLRYLLARPQTRQALSK